MQATEDRDQRVRVCGALGSGMFALTKKTEYALIAVSYLARRPHEVSSAREIACATRVGLPILTNILKTLAGAGIVVSERGANGGYALARRPDAVSLHELIHAVEGPFQFVQCVGVEGDEPHEHCEHEGWCSIRGPAMRVHERLRTFLEKVTLAELVSEGNGLIQVRSHEVGPASTLVEAARECGG